MHQSTPGHSTPGGGAASHPAKPERQEGYPLWMWILFSVFTFAIVAVGYRTGFRSEDSANGGGSSSKRRGGGNSAITNLLVREERLRERIQQCEEHRKQLVKNQKAGGSDAEKDALDNLTESLKGIEEDNAQLFEQQKRLDEARTKCEADVDHDRTKAAAASRAEIEKLKSKIQEAEQLRRSLEDYHAGARRVLLLQVLKQRRQRNYDMRQELMMPVPEENYEDMLIMKWNVSEKADGFPDDVSALPFQAWTSRAKRAIISGGGGGGGDTSSSSTQQSIDDSISKITKKWAPFPMNDRQREQMQSQGDALAFPKEQGIFFVPGYDHTVAESGALDDAKSEVITTLYRPQYFGRVGNAEPVEGVVAQTQVVRLTLSQILRVIVRVSYCALKTNSPNFTVPAEFRRPSPIASLSSASASGGSNNNNNNNNNKNLDDAAKDAQDAGEPPLRDLPAQFASLAIDAPLIRFCTKCTHTVQTAEFKLACSPSAIARQSWSSQTFVQKKEVAPIVRAKPSSSPSAGVVMADAANTDSAIAMEEDDQKDDSAVSAEQDQGISSPYGSYDFWRARSRVRFSPLVISRVNVFLRTEKMLPNTTLAVAFKRSQRWEDACRTRLAKTTLPLKHYMLLAARAQAKTNGSLLEVASPDDVVAQCAPSIKDLQKAIVSIAQVRDYIDTVYIALDVSDKEMLERELQRLDVGPLHVVVSAPTDVVADAEEMLIMSMSDSILANRFSEHSQHVTELFLLQNRLRGEGVSFF